MGLSNYHQLYLPSFLNVCFQFDPPLLAEDEVTTGSSLMTESTTMTINAQQDCTGIDAAYRIRYHDSTNNNGTY